jgi:hypothetical protein
MQKQRYEACSRKWICNKQTWKDQKEVLLE